MENIEKAARELCRLEGSNPDQFVSLGEGWQGNHTGTARHHKYAKELLRDYLKLKALLSVPEIRADLLSNK